MLCMKAYLLCYAYITNIGQYYRKVIIVLFLFDENFEIGTLSNDRESYFFLSRFRVRLKRVMHKYITKYFYSKLF